MSVRSDVSDTTADQLVVHINNVKNIYFLLKAINFKERATIFATEDGLKITVEDSKTVQASAYIQKYMFQDYKLSSVDDQPVVFCVDLGVFLECLNIFGCASSSGSSDVTALKLCYRGHGFPVRLILTEEGSLTDCSIHTCEREELMTIDFSPDTVCNKVILQAEPLKDLFAAVDHNTALLELLLSPDKPHVRFTMSGTTGEECHVEFPKDSDIVESFECTTTSKSRYYYTHIKPALKILAVSHKLSLRTNNASIMCLQFMVSTEDSHTCYIEYYCMPIVHDD